VVFVSHCDFKGNSAMHVFSIANELQALGVSSAVFVPNDPETVHAHGVPRFRFGQYEDALRGPLIFPDGRGPDLIHAWTPRESVRQFTQTLLQRYVVPYIVHLEDNEEVILENELEGPSFADLGTLPPPIVDRLVPSYRSHPAYYPPFLSRAAGMTVVMDRLLEFNRARVPAAVFWPGFDPAFAEARPDQAFRSHLGVNASDLMLVYNGTVHRTNVAEVGSLVDAVGALHRRGLPVVLVKTGVDHVAVPYLDEGKKQGFILDLGYRPREDVPRLLAAADVLVQPGRAGDFNDYRFPSKLPEFLVSGRPVMLPRTNIGRFLKDDIDCVLLYEGHGLEIAAKLETLFGDLERRKRIGAAGRDFALRELTWPRAATRIKALYDEVLDGSRRPSSGPSAGIATAAPATSPQEGGSQGNESPRPEQDSWAKLVAFYLPQYHPIPENDKWWGEGFTEWTNVKRAKPNFAGHYQPQVPTELGYYDLRDPGVMDRQIELARDYGIHGFCFYYYWFNGHRLLERPLDQMLSREDNDFPFCICWANENWTRRWDGSEDKILMEQAYAPGYAEEFIRDVIPLLKDRRYMKIGRAPLILVYRVDLLPDPQEAARVWRQVCAAEGIPEIHLAAAQTFGTIDDPRPHGFDAAVDFPPHTTHQALISPKKYRRTIKDFRGFLADYQEAVRLEVEEPPPPYLRYRGVMPAWDNTPRRLDRAYVYVESSPARYQAWLEQMVEWTMKRSSVQEPIVFLNAWNEWGEGAYLEPDSKHGRARLEATRRGLCRGMTAYYAGRGFAVTESMVESALAEAGVLG
jgi:glycosyltransferase involved in cell wall biosynthesis